MTEQRVGGGWRAGLAVAALILSSALTAQEWFPLKGDGVHDPRSPGVRLKQDPAEGLGALYKGAPDPTVGNQIRWVKAIESGLISPRTNIFPETKIQVLDLDIFLGVGGSMGVVRFPHRAHTLWLDCKNCHEHLFVSHAGANPVKMQTILEGEQCGLCHGAVAFPLIECNRCHSVPQGQFTEMLKADPKLKVGSGGTYWQHRPLPTGPLMPVEKASK